MVCSLAVITSSPVIADDPPAAIGQFLTVTAPVDDVMFGRVSQAALELQSEAAESGRRAVLVLQIMPGASPFHQIQGLSKFLSSAQINQVTTVAWIPETLTGPHVLLALACREIVMPEGVSIGDIGRGQKLDPEEVQWALALAQKRLNPKLNAAIVRGLMNPETELWKVRFKTDAGPVETRIFTRPELDELRKSKTVIEEAVAIKEAGTPGMFSGKAARGWDILVTHLADSRATVAELYGLPREAQREQLAADGKPRARMIRIQGQIDPMLEGFLVRQIHQAEQDGVTLLIFELESNGGQLLPSINLAYAIAELDPQQTRTVAYIPDTAFSGAALVAMACDEVYLTPASRWGSATPSNPREAAAFERAPEKVAQLRLALKNLAEKKGRPAALAEAMADRSVVVYQTTHADQGRTWYHSAEELHASDGQWIQGPMVPEADGTKTLIVDGRRAAELKLAQPPVSSFDEMKQRLGIPAAMRIARAEPTWVDQLVFVLNRPEATVALLVIAIALLYLEAHFTTTILGILSVLCFALFFWSKALGGTAGWLEVMLFVLGLVCLGVEAFLIPGFGMFGVSGIMLLLSSLVMASQTFGNLEPSADWNQLAASFGTLFTALIVMGVLGMFLSRVLPSLPFLDSMVLAPPGSSPNDADQPRLRPLTETTINSPAELVSPGQLGVSLSILRPAGKAQVDDHVLDVVSDGPYIPAGSPIEIVSVHHNRIVVRQV